MSLNDEMMGRMARMSMATTRPSADVLSDRTGAFGGVLASLHIKAPAEAKALRQALQDGMATARSHEASSYLSRCVAEIDGVLRRASEQRWIGWESVHTPE